MTSISRMALFAGGAAMMALGITKIAEAAPFPALTKPATTEHRPGKLIWADLFTSDPDSATKFYCGLLGWTATSVDQKGKAFVIFTNDGEAVAGLAPHSSGKENRPSRWVGYVSVVDLKATLATVEKNGGILHAHARNFPDRGHQAIIGDNDGNPIGLLQSSSGDPDDDATKPGEWNWFEIYAKDPLATSKFYHEVLNFDVAPETRSERKSEFLLSSEGNTRGGIAPLPGDSEDAKPSWLGVIRVADLDVTLAKVGALGGKILLAPHSVEFGSRFAIILDSTGGTVGLVQYLETENPAKNP